MIFNILIVCFKNTFIGLKSKVVLSPEGTTDLIK